VSMKITAKAAIHFVERIVLSDLKVFIFPICS
jgi:hypothetical protein